MLVSLKKTCPELSIKQIERLTIYEIEIIQKAQELRKLDDRYNISMLAWRTAQAQATNKRGESVYKKFDSFFDYEDEYERIMGFDQNKVPMDQNLYELIKKANEGGEVNG